MNVNAQIAEILTTRKVSNGQATFDLHSSISADEGEHLARWLREIAPDTYLEIGLAYGVSALFAGSTLAANNKPYRHIILDPVQTEMWHGVGRHNLQQAKLWQHVEFHEQGSEVALPAILSAGTRLQAAFIDGWHTFDHALIDFFYINRMLDKGGIVIFDDAHWPALTKLIRYVLKYPAYELYGRSRRHLLRGIARDLWHGRLPRLMPSMVALRKVADDARSWDWYRSF